MPVSFDEFYELLCVVRNEQVRMRDQVNQLLQEMKIPQRISFTLQEAADLTGFSYATLYYMAKNGKLMVSQPEGNGRMVVQRDELLRLLNEGKLKKA